MARSARLQLTKSTGPLRERGHAFKTETPPAVSCPGSRANLNGQRYGDTTIFARPLQHSYFTVLSRCRMIEIKPGSDLAAGEMDLLHLHILDVVKIPHAVDELTGDLIVAGRDAQV